VVKNLINYISVFIIFSGAFVIQDVVFGPLEADLYLYYLWILLLLPVFWQYSKLKLHIGFLVIVLVLFFIGTINVFIGNNIFSLLLKQIIGVVLMGTFFFYLLKLNDYDYKKLFGIYMDISKFIVAIAIIQVIAYALNIRFLYDFSYIIPGHRIDTTSGGLRVSSILTEPSHFAIAMAPALFIATLNIIKGTTHFIGRKASFFILISLLLTFSLVAYIIVILSFLFVSKNPFGLMKILISSTVLLLSVTVLYFTVDMVTSRIDGLIDLFVYQDTHRVNISSFTLFNNATVAFQNFAQHPLFGTGLGSHQHIFDLYAYKDVYGTTGNALILNTLNKEDANSLFLRVISETGLLGIILIFLFLLKYRVKSTDYGSIEWVVSTAILIFIIAKLLRDGHYFNNGMMFFVWIYYYVGKFKSKLKDELSDS
jgi:hypothetical protein